MPNGSSHVLFRRLGVWAVLSLIAVSPGGRLMFKTRSPDAETPLAAVHRWWTAWERKDLDLIGAMALEDYIEFTGNSDGPRLGRATLLEVARRAFARATIRRWEVSEPVIRQEGNVAVVAYRWTEQATLEGRALSLQGIATDVLVRRKGMWRYLSHHSTPLRRTEWTIEGHKRLTPRVSRDMRRKR